MRLLDRLVVRELIGPFIFGVAAFASIFFAGRNLLKIITDVVKGLPISAALELVALQLPSILVTVLPMAVLLGTLLAFSRLSSESEIIALYAGGASLYRIVVSALVLGVLVSALGFVLNEMVAPRANIRAGEIRRNLLKEEVAVQKPVPLADIKDGVTNSLVYVQGGMDSKTRRLRNVTVIIFRKNSPDKFLRAKDAVWKGGFEWSLRDGYFQSLTVLTASGKPVPVSTGTFSEMNLTISHTPEEIELYQTKAEDLNFMQLLDKIRKLNALRMPTVAEELELYNKIAVPLSAFIFAVLACSLGLTPHRGGSSVGLGLSVLIIIVYLIVWHFMSAMAKNGSVDPMIGSFTACALGLAAGVALLARAAR